MLKTFTIKNTKGNNLGEIIFLEEKFRVNIPAGPEREELKKLLDSFVKEGICDLGEVILEQPIRVGDALFFDEIRNQLARKGYILTEETEKI